MLKPIHTDKPFADPMGNGNFRLTPEEVEKYGPGPFTDHGKTADGKWIYWPKGYKPPKGYSGI